MNLYKLLGAYIYLKYRYIVIYFHMPHLWLNVNPFDARTVSCLGPYHECIACIDLCIYAYTFSVKKNIPKIFNDIEIIN